MEIVVADVKDNVDLFKTGRFLVQFQNYQGPVEVKYVSPYVTQNNKGFMAVPEIGTQVLICKPDNRNDWYYMGGILEPTVADSKAIGKITEEGIVDPFTDVYKTRNVVPQKYLFSSPRGNKLVLSDAYSPTEGNFKVMLESSLGMKVELNDTIGALIIRNRTGAAMITIMETNSSVDGGGSDSITVECTGNVNLTSRNANMDIQVIDGRTLNILNSSTGINRIGQNDPTAGNINITSNYGDINVLAKGDDQQIRLDATGQSGDIVVNATGTISMSADEGVFINSSDGNININGQKIYLN